MIDKFAHNLTKHGKLYFALAIALLIALSFFIKTPHIESRIEDCNVDNNPYDSVGQQITKLFASKNMIQVMVKPESTSVQVLFDGLQEVKNDLEDKFPGIRVESLNSASKLILRKVNPDSSYKAALVTALQIPIAQNLVSKDTNSLLLVAFTDKVENFSVSQFDSIIAKQYKGIKRMIAVSRVHIQDSIDSSIKRDYLVLFPLILIFIVGFLYYTYRNISAVVFCLINLSLSIIPTLFFMSIFNVKINQVTVPAIPVVLILSLSAAVHLVTGYIHRSDIKNKQSRISQTLYHYFVPSFFSALTTSISFASFYLSDSLYIRQFGIVAACSIIVVLAITYLISPFLLRMISDKTKSALQFGAVFKLENALLNHRKIISISLIAVAAISIFLIPQLTFKTNLETYIPRHGELYRNIETIKKGFHSIADIDLLIQPVNEKIDSAQLGATRRELIEVVTLFSNQIAEYPEVSSVQSIKNQIDFENHFTIPGFRATLFPRSINPFVSKDQLNYRINIKLLNPEDLEKVMSQLNADFGKYNYKFKQSAYSDFLYFEYISSSVTESLLRSLLSSAVLIILILYALTGSITKTLVSIIANTVPLGILIILLVLLGIDMNITTSISLVICLGLIVDDTIQIIYRRVRLNEPLEELGIGVLVTSIIITGGFLTFVLSESRPNQVFGLICALVFILAAICDMTIMTWLLNKKAQPK